MSLSFFLSKLYATCIDEVFEQQHLLIQITEIYNFFYSYNACPCISKKYLPQMIHQLILRFCQDKIQISNENHT